MGISFTPSPEYFRHPDEVVEFIRQHRLVAIDTETTGLDIFQDHITIWSIAAGNRCAACGRYSLEGLKRGLQLYPDTTIVFHNRPFDSHMLLNAGIDVVALVGPGNIFDTMVMDNLLNPDGRHDLKLLAKNRLGIMFTPYKQHNFTAEDIGDESKGLMPSARFRAYACLDAWATLKLFEILSDELMRMHRISKVREVWGLQMPSMFDYYAVIDQPLSTILVDMVRRGIRIDTGYLQSILPLLDERIKKEKNNVCRMASLATGEKLIINPNSAPQMRELFYNKLGYKPPERGGKSKKTGDLSVDANVLMMLADMPAPHPGLIGFPDAVLGYRGWVKLKSTYGTGLIKRLHGDRLHTALNQQVTATGRLSCVSGATLLHTTRGSFRFDEYVPHVGDKVRTHTGALKPILRKVYKGIDKMFRVGLANGAAMECTADHRVLTPSGWVRVGDLAPGDSVRTYDVSVEALYSEPGERETRPGRVPVSRQADTGRDSETTLHDVPQCELCDKRAPAKREGEGRAGFEVFPIQDGSSQSHEGKNRRAAPQLDRGVQRRLRLPDLSRGREEGVRAQGCVCGDAGDRSRGPLPGARGAPRQRGSAGQQTRQSSNGHDGRPPAYPYEGETGTVVEITALGPMGVWTIEVAEDHSYATHGFYSKNSSNPNLQNLPRASDPSIRRAFIPSEGHVLIDADWSQIEIRVLAHMSMARTIIDPLLAGIDVHSLTAADVFNHEYERVLQAAETHKDQRTDDDWVVAGHRTVAKMVNFGIPYNITGHGLSANLKKQADMDITPEECTQYIETYFVKHPDVGDYNRRLFETVRAQGYVTTMLGRPRMIGGLEGRRPNHHSVSQVYNTPIQGSAGELMKLKMIEFGNDPELKKMGVQMLLQVHDELLMEVPKENADDAAQYVKHMMAQQAVDLVVPTPADVQVGDNWGDLH